MPRYSEAYLYHRYYTEEVLRIVSMFICAEGSENQTRLSSPAHLAVSAKYFSQVINIPSDFKNLVSLARLFFPPPFRARMREPGKTVWITRLTCIHAHLATALITSDSISLLPTSNLCSFFRLLMLLQCGMVAFHNASLNHYMYMYNIIHMYIVRIYIEYTCTVYMYWYLAQQLFPNTSIHTCLQCNPYNS